MSESELVRSIFRIKARSEDMRKRSALEAQIPASVAWRNV